MQRSCYSFHDPKLKKVDSEANLPDLVAETDKKSLFRRAFKFLYLPAVQSPGARLLMFMRLLMGLAFNVFMTIWTVSLKRRFDFGPRDHAFFMGWIGLCYALSQGVVAQYFIKFAGENPTNLLCACAVSLSAGRVMAMMTSSLAAVYVIMAAVIIALGIINTAMSSAVTKLADADQIGGLMGVMEAIENCAGLVEAGSRRSVVQGRQLHAHRRSGDFLPDCLRAHQILLQKPYCGA